LIFALDSNVVIHAMKGARRVAARLARMNPAEIAIPAVVVYELEFGTLRSSDPERRQKELERLPGAAHGAKLISHNTRDFARVPGLQIEDWF
jgi:tRNA(fMet)-specific endonuclease VapC